MSSDLAYVNRLLSENNCPACGAARSMTWGIDPAKDSGIQTRTFAAYDCGATFHATAGGIAVGDACPGASNVAAAMLMERVRSSSQAVHGRAA